MKQFIRKSALFLLPLILWAIIVVIIDPFNYWNISSVISTDIKEKNARRLNSLLYLTLDYINNPCENMLIGDSRTGALPITLIQDISKLEYKKFTTQAAKLNEIIDLIYLANSKQKLKHVVIGINFNMFNEFGYADRVSGLKKIIDNPLLYIYNKDVAEVCFYSLRSLLTGINVNSDPRVSKEEFWKWNIKTKASHWYERYKYPVKLYAKLFELDTFAKNNHIELLFIIIPHHIEFHNRLVEFGLEKEEVKFIEELSNLNARVINYDYSNSITINKNNFNDPIHYNHDIGNLIINEIWNNNLNIGKEL